MIVLRDGVSSKQENVVEPRGTEVVKSTPPGPNEKTRKNMKGTAS